MSGGLFCLPSVTRQVQIDWRSIDLEDLLGGAVSHFAGRADELTALVEIEHAAAEGDRTQEQKKGSTHDAPFKAHPSLWGVG